MDIAVFISFLSPYLPLLLKLGDQAVEKTTEATVAQLSDINWNKATILWRILQPNLEGTSDLKAAMEQVAGKPDSNARRAVLQEELEVLFKSQPWLLASIETIMQYQDSTHSSQAQIQQPISVGSILNVRDITSIGSTVNIAGTGAITVNPMSPKIEQSSEILGAVPSARTILMVVANPRGTQALRLDEEARELERGLARSKHRDRFRIEQRWAVTYTDLRRVLLDFQPEIVHFSGHGGGDDGLVFEDESGQLNFVSGEAIAQLFSIFSANIECVVLNACYSEVQAKQIVQYIPHVIGMKKEIGDRAAIEFSIGFYDGLLAGRSVKDAYRLGCNAIQGNGIPEELTPVLLSNLS
jgi:CHAT domain